MVMAHACYWAYQNDLLVKLMRGWEANFPPRKPPPLLIKH
jgi:hypothetical protein